MREIGERLRQAREERGLTLEQVAGNTKIRTRYLKAIEEGEFAVIPGEIYVRGFLQNYATAVGLDSQEILDVYDRLRAARAVPETLSENTAHTAAESIRPHFVWWQPVLIMFSILLLGTLLFIGINRDNMNQEVPPPIDYAAEEPPSEPIADAASALEDEKGLELVLKFIRRCWVEVRCDGSIVYEGILEAGMERIWNAQTIIEVHYGNPGGVIAVLNGDDLGVQGEIGIGLKKTYTRS